jgi:hypothetical protein
MRLTDHRYRRDKHKLDLAIRMIHHEARTATIQAWTGLTGDRVRKLHREYVRERGESFRRHRGKPPRQSGYFLRNVELRRQSVALGGLYALHGLLRGESLAGITDQNSPPWAELFCDAYETYLTLGVGSAVTFEHAAFLLEALQQRIDLRPGRCPTCNAFAIVDTQRRTAPLCPLCETDPWPCATEAPIPRRLDAARSSQRARIPALPYDIAQPQHLRRPLSRP